MPVKRTIPAKSRRPATVRRTAASKAAPKGPAAGGKCQSRPTTAPGWMIIAAFALLALLALVLVYQYAFVVLRALRVSPEGFDGKPSGPPPVQARLVFLHMDGCGHCDRFKPQWDAFDSQYGDGLKASGVVLESYERADPEASEFKGSVNGYPTVLLVKVPAGSASPIVFQGDRTPEGLAGFLKDNGFGKGLVEGYVEPATGMQAIHATTSGAKAQASQSTAVRAKDAVSTAGTSKLGKQPSSEPHA